MSLYTMRYIAKTVAMGLFDSDIYTGLWTGMVEIVYALLTFCGRTAMLLLFPVSVPMLWAFFRIMEPINQRRRAAYRRRMVNSYRNDEETRA